MLTLEYQKTLKIAIGIHAKSKTQVDKKVKNKKLAIYYLQGGCLTQAVLAIKQWGMGDLNAPIRAKRFIDEAHYLSLFFSILNDDSRHLKRWFNNEIVTVPNLEKKPLLKKKLLKRKRWDEKLFQEWHRIGKILYQGFSKSVHPNLESVAFNSDRDTLEFDYTCDDLSFYPIRNFDFATFIIIPAIDSLLMNNDVLSIEEKDMARLQKSRDKIQKISKDLWKKRQRKKNRKAYIHFIGN